MTQTETSKRGDTELERMRLQVALDAARMGTWEWVPESDSVVADGRVFEILGMPPRSVIGGEEMFACVHEHDRTRVREAMESALASGGIFMQTYRIVRPGSGEVRWIAARGAPVPVASDEPLRLIGVIYDVTASKEAEEALRSSEERFQLAMGAVSGLIYDWDVKSGQVYRSGGVFDLLGVPPEEVEPTRQWWIDRLHPEDRDAVLAQMDAWLAGDEEYYDHEYRMRRGDGQWVHVWDQGRILRDAVGNPVRVVGSRADISERKRAEERQRLLMAELDHRVKNILANVGAIAHRTSQRGASIQDFIASLEGRIRAMATAHSLLSATRWEGAHLNALVTEVLAPFVSPTRRNVRFGGPEVVLTPKAAQSLALGLHELVTNAAKHGALSTPSGRIAATWEIVANSEQHLLRLHWQESNGPRVAEPKEKGFGLTVLQDMLCQDLSAQVACDFPPAGVSCSIAFPLSHTVGMSPGTEPAPPRPAPAAAARSADTRTASPLEGRRILVVEDTWVVGLQLKTVLEVLGHHVVGPAATLDEALALAELDNLDAAILDIRLDDSHAFPVADRLRERDVPFGFASGYSDEFDLPHRFRNAPRIGKPYADGGIEELLDKLLAD